MLYINPNNEYPRHVGDIQIENPEWNYGDPLPSGWLEVVPSEAPIVVDGKVLVEMSPEQVDGVWSQVWALRDLTEEELAFKNAPTTARQKLRTVVGLTDIEIDSLIRGLR